MLAMKSNQGLSSHLHPTGGVGMGTDTNSTSGKFNRRLSSGPSDQPERMRTHGRVGITFVASTVTVILLARAYY